MDPADAPANRTGGRHELRKAWSLVRPVRPRARGASRRSAEGDPDRLPGDPLRARRADRRALAQGCADVRRGDQRQGRRARPQDRARRARHQGQRRRGRAHRPRPDPARERRFPRRHAYLGRRARRVAGGEGEQDRLRRPGREDRPAHRAGQSASVRFPHGDDDHDRGPNRRRDHVEVAGQEGRRR